MNADRFKLRFIAQSFWSLSIFGFYFKLKRKSMKKFLSILSILLFLFSQVAHSQKTNIKWGQTEKGSNQKGLNEAIGWHDGNYYTIRSKYIINLNKYVYTLEKSDKNLNLKFSKKLDYDVYYDYLNPILKEGKIITFGTKINNKDKKIELYSTTIDLSGNLIENKQLTSLKYQGRVIRNDLVSELYISKNKKYLGFSHARVDTDQNKMNLQILLFDLDEFSQIALAEKTFQLNEKADRATISDMLVTNDGIVSTVYGSYDVTLNSMRNDFSNPFMNSLIILDESGNLLPPIPLKTDDLLLSDVTLKMIKDKVFMTGFLLMLDNNRESTVGFFLGEVDLENNSIKNFNAFPYKKEFFETLGYKVKNSGKINFEGYFKLQLAETDAGDGFLLAHHRWKRGSDNPLFYEYEILAIPFDRTGKLGEVIVLPKKQGAFGRHRIGLGYFTFSKQNKLYLLYNDHVDNLMVNDLDKLKDEKNVNSNKVGTFIATLEAGKELKRKELFNYKEDEGYLVADKCFDGGDIITLNKGDGRAMTFGKLTIQ